MATDPKVISKYATGYSQCATEVTHYLGKLDGLDQEVKSRLSSHLNNCVQKLNAAANSQVTSTPMTSFPVASTAGHAQPQIVSVAPSSGILTQQQIDVALGQIGGQLTGQLSGNDKVNLININDANSQNSQLNQQQTVINQQQPQSAVAGVPLLPVQLIPAKLPSGDVVLLLTNNQNQNQTIQQAPNVATPITITPQGAQVVSAAPPSTVTTDVSTPATSPQQLVMAPTPLTVAPQTPKVSEIPVPDSSTSPKDKVAPVGSSLSNMTSRSHVMSQSSQSSMSPLNVTSQTSSHTNSPPNYSNLIPPYPVPSFQINPTAFSHLNKDQFVPHSLEKPKPLKVETSYHLALDKPGPSHHYPRPPSPSEALDLSDPNKDLNNNYRQEPNRNAFVFHGNPENDPMWRPW